MKVNLETDNVTKEISAKLAKLPEMAEKKEKKLFEGIKRIITSQLIRFMPRSQDNNRKNFDGTLPYVHMQDDIKAKITQKDGFASILFSGGKKTAFKWHLVDDGARFPDGRVKNRASHFTEKAMKESEDRIDDLIDSFMEELANGIGDEDTN